MADQITLEEALKLVTFIKNNTGEWCVGIVRGNVLGTVCGGVGGDVIGNVFGGVGGDVRGNVEGSVLGHVNGDVGGSVSGKVLGTISGKKWTSIETPRDKLARLIEEKGDQELIEAFNELVDSNG